MLTWVLACAIEEGWIDTNPAQVTRKFTHTRIRARLTLETYKVVRAKAPHWLQLAMDISLMTLLRREYVVTLRFSDYRDGHLWVVPSKTGTTKGARVKIVVNAEVAALLSKARDSIAPPLRRAPTARLGSPQRQTC